MFCLSKFTENNKKRENLEQVAIAVLIRTFGTIQLLFVIVFRHAWLDLICLIFK